MKKTALFLLVIFCLALVACGNQTAKQSAPERYAFTDSAGLVDMTDMGTVLRYSSNVVSATLSSVNDFDGVVEVYQFAVDTDYTNNTPEKIHVYDAYHEAYAVGHSYFLFLEQTENAFYPHPIFTTVSKDLILDITKQELSGEITNNGSEVMLSDIHSVIADALENGGIGDLVSYNGQASLLSDDPETLYTQADAVARVRFSNEREENPYISGYEVFCAAILKGPADSVAEYMFLSPGLLPDTDYDLFLAEDFDHEGTYYPIHNAVLASDVDDMDFMR